MNKFEILDHTGDVGLVAWGETKEEVSPMPLWNVFSHLQCREVNGGFATQVEVEGSDYEDLWSPGSTSSLPFEAEEVLLKEFNIQELGQYYLKAQVEGEPLDS